MLSLKIISAFILDLILGDPRSVTHPVIFIGKMIERLERILRKAGKDRTAGILLVIIVVFITFFVTWGLSSISVIIEVILMYTVFAVKSLAGEANNIYNSLKESNIGKARKEISYLVSRDTENMNKDDIIRATVETVAENIVDGVTAPMFYLFAGGVPLAMTYKAVNTMDSMVGYKNEKYLHFGWAAARLDDVLNFIPARITAFVLIPLAAVLTGKDAAGSLKVLIRDRYNHSSPNSGHSEAAAAGALGYQIGGPTSYFGEVHHKPFIGDKTRELTEEDIADTIKLMYATSAFALAAGTAVILSLNYLF